MLLCSSVEVQCLGTPVNWFVVTGHAAILCFWKCASGITDEDTAGVTDGELGKNFPDRDLGFGWEEQDGLTAEMIRCDFLE